MVEEYVLCSERGILAQNKRRTWAVWVSGLVREITSFRVRRADVTEIFFATKKFWR